MLLIIKYEYTVMNLSFSAILHVLTSGNLSVLNGKMVIS